MTANPNKANIHAFIDRDLYERVRRLATKRGQSFSRAFEESLQMWASMAEAEEAQQPEDTEEWRP